MTSFRNNSDWFNIATQSATWRHRAFAGQPSDGSPFWRRMTALFWFGHIWWNITAHGKGWPTPRAFPGVLVIPPLNNYRSQPVLLSYSDLISPTVARRALIGIIRVICKPTRAALSHLDAASKVDFPPTHYFTLRALPNLPFTPDSANCPHTTFGGTQQTISVKGINGDNL